MAAFIFFLLSVVAIVSALMVVTQKHPVYSALFLVLNLLSLAGFYVTLEAPMLAAIQVIVYAGAIVVLFVFVVMLLDLRKSRIGQRRFPYQGAIASLLASIFVFTMFLVFYYGDAGGPTGMMTVMEVNGSVEQIGFGLFREWLYPLEVCSALLLAAIVGVIVLANNETREQAS